MYISLLLKVSLTVSRIGDGYKSLGQYHHQCGRVNILCPEREGTAKLPCRRE